MDKKWDKKGKKKSEKRRGPKKERKKKKKKEGRIKIRQKNFKLLPLSSPPSGSGAS